MFEKEVTVQNVVSTVEIGTGKMIYAVSFGETYEATREIATRAGFTPGMTDRVVATYLTLYFQCDREVPYRVGGKWKIKVSDDGTVSVVESK